MSRWAAGRGLLVGRVGAEVGSGLEGGRELLALGCDPSVTAIVVERWGRWVRFGAEHVRAVLAARGRRLVMPPLRSMTISEPARATLGGVPLGDD